MQERSVRRAAGIIVLSLMFAIMTCVLSPSVACADVTIGDETLHGWTVNEAVTTWSPQDMTNAIGENTGVKVESLEPDNGQSDSNPTQIIESIASAAPLASTIIFMSILLIGGVAFLMTFIVLCGTLINYIKCKCEHQSQAEAYEQYTNKLIAALLLTALLEAVVAAIWIITSI